MREAGATTAILHFSFIASPALHFIGEACRFRRCSPQEITFFAASAVVAWPRPPCSSRPAGGGLGGPIARPARDGTPQVSAFCAPAGFFLLRRVAAASVWPGQS